MKKKEQDSPLFSDSIMSTEDIFETEEEFDNNGLNLDLDHESLNDFEPTEPVQTIPLEAPLDEPLPEPDFSDTQDIFREEPVQEVSSGIKPVSPQSTNRVTTPVNVASKPVSAKPTPQQLYAESYSDEPKKSYRKPIILSLIFIVIALGLIWFVFSFFSSSTETNPTVTTPTTTEQRQNDTLFNNRNNTNKNQPTTTPSQTQKPTVTPDNSTNDSITDSGTDYPSYTYPDDDNYYDDYYPDEGTGDESYYPDDSQDSYDSGDSYTNTETDVQGTDYIE